MNKHVNPSYIETPRRTGTTTRIDAILEQRIKEFMLSRRRFRWINTGE